MVRSVATTGTTERAVPPGDVIRLPRAGRAWRVLLFAVLTSLFLAGTAVGQDDWWPFGPWRMFSTSTPPSSAVYALRIEVQTAGAAGWQPAALTPSSVGLNRAEVEGRIPEMTAQPAILATLARSHSRLRPDEPSWQAIRVVRREVLLADGAPTGAVREKTLAQWSRP